MGRKILMDTFHTPDKEQILVQSDHCTYNRIAAVRFWPSSVQDIDLAAEKDMQQHDDAVRIHPNDRDGFVAVVVVDVAAAAVADSVAVE